MAKIGLYNEPYGSGIGGSEYQIAVLAEALSKTHEVELVHHRSPLSVEQLEEFSETDLRSVRLRYVEPVADQLNYSRNLVRRYQVAREWRASLSEPYDLFICSMHGQPPFCHAPKGVLLVLFPFFLPVHGSPQSSSDHSDSIRKRLSLAYYKWEWKKRMAGYEVKTAISSFTQTWAQRRWGIDCQVIYPPVENRFRIVPKSNIILSVGRFSVEGEGHGKKQLEMLNAFSGMYAAGFKDWEYASVGSVGGSPRHQTFFDELRRAGAGCHAQLMANIDRKGLKELFERARIFWHAAGYGADENGNPELAEHFGIVTVEAMAAGCVPVVINRGAQGEIVEHGISGYLWNTLDELKEYTTLLARDDQLLRRMSTAARERARVFSRDIFVEKFRDLLKPLLGGSL
jgi:glycosyltransferase involved in cell wall biosynthesis